MKFQNVIIFGDSLSDIGKMLDSKLGGLRKVGLLQVNETGRFSDCRNWTDYMYTNATRDELIKDNIKRTRHLTKPYQTFSDACLITPYNGFEFRYANYAVGGACGFQPASHDKRLALTTLDDEISYFKKDYKKMETHIKSNNEKFLFIIWFGANDLYTANRTPREMGIVAEHITGPSRQKILSIVGQGNATFVYVNLGLPLSATRYANMQVKMEQHYFESLMNGNASSDSLPANDFKIRQIINNLTSGALVFNNELRECTSQNEDLYVDMCNVIKPQTMQILSTPLKVQEGSQPKGSLKTFYTPMSYREKFAATPLEHMTLEDDVHPTDHIYGLMWTVIKHKLTQAKITFGLINTGNFNISAVNQNLETIIAPYVDDLSVV